eukprot:4080435-Prymnesium_polylepis.1
MARPLVALVAVHAVAALRAPPSLLATPAWRLPHASKAGRLGLLPVCAVETDERGARRAPSFSRTASEGQLPRAQAARHVLQASVER